MLNSLHVYTTIIGTVANRFINFNDLLAYNIHRSPEYVEVDHITPDIPVKPNGENKMKSLSFSIDKIMEVTHDTVNCSNKSTINHITRSPYEDQSPSVPQDPAPWKPTSRLRTPVGGVYSERMLTSSSALQTSPRVSEQAGIHTVLHHTKNLTTLERNDTAPAAETSQYHQNLGAIIDLHQRLASEASQVAIHRRTGGSNFAVRNLANNAIASMTSSLYNNYNNHSSLMRMNAANLHPEFVLDALNEYRNKVLKRYLQQPSLASRDELLPPFKSSLESFSSLTTAGHLQSNVLQSPRYETVSCHEELNHRDSLKPAVNSFSFQGMNGQNTSLAVAGQAGRFNSPHSGVKDYGKRTEKVLLLCESRTKWDSPTIHGCNGRVRKPSRCLDSNNDIQITESKEFEKIKRLRTETTVDNNLNRSETSGDHRTTTNNYFTKKRTSKWPTSVPVEHQVASLPSSMSDGSGSRKLAAAPITKPYTAGPEAGLWDLAAESEDELDVTVTQGLYSPMNGSQGGYNEADQDDDDDNCSMSDSTSTPRFDGLANMDDLNVSASSSSSSATGTRALDGDIDISVQHQSLGLDVGGGCPKILSKAFVCPDCGKQFNAHYNLTRHMPVHTG